MKKKPIQNTMNEAKFENHKKEMKREKKPKPNKKKPKQKNKKKIVEGKLSNQVHIFSTFDI